MKTLLIGLIFLGTGLFAVYPSVNTEKKESVLIQTMLMGLNQVHFHPKAIDDTFSQEVYDVYLDAIDHSKRFLVQSEIDELKKYKTDIDDEALGGTYEFFNQSLTFIDKAIARAEGFYKKSLHDKIDINEDEIYEADGDKKEFAKDANDLEKRWAKIVKFEVISNLLDKQRAQEKALQAKEKDPDFKEKSFDELKGESIEEATKTFDRWFKRLGELRRSDRLSVFLNAITSIYDPHTNYFAPKDKEDFDINMSGTLEGIGARLTREGDYVKVSSIVAGGPAWKGKELEAEDLIVKVAQGDEEALDITGYRVDDAVKYIRGKKGTEVRLTVKKPDGSMKTISIIRDIVIMDAGFAKSAIISDSKLGEKIGYIKLPKFYADFQRRDGRRCAADIKKELNKLKSNNVDGIILDLRNNGGGSLRDVVKMAGFFIEEGPVVQVEASDKSVEVLKDTDDAVEYDGELIVLVNSHSASASEILAAALQDYDRAIIVGSKSTYGKGTVQRFINLDRAAAKYKDLLPLGDMKLTTSKFYRINGGSTQRKGVVPDVILPDNYSYIETGERDEEYALKWTEIDKLNYAQDINTNPNKAKVIANSKLRTDANPVFSKVDKNAKRWKKLRDETEIELNYAKYKKQEDLEKEESAKFKDIFKPIESLSVSNLPQDMDYIQVDSSRIGRNEDFIKNIKKDSYIDESLYIMHDLLTVK